MGRSGLTFGLDENANCRRRLAGDFKLGGKLFESASLLVIALWVSWSRECGKGNQRDQNQAQ
jgi:hypothetical protein